MSYTLFQKQVVNTLILVYIATQKTIYDAGAQDFKCQPDSGLLHDAKDVYGYRGNFLVDETLKAFAHSVCAEYELQYPPLSHEDALYLYFIIKDECEKFSM